MIEISEQKLHEFIYSIKGQEEIEELGISLWVFQKMKGDVQLPVEDFLKIKELFTEHYCGFDNRDFPEWCLLVSGYLIRYKKYDDVKQLLGTALVDVKLRYYLNQKSVAILESYITVLFSIAEFYFKEKNDYICSSMYYGKAYGLLVHQSEEIRNKMNNFNQWMDDIFEKIELLMKMDEDNKPIDMRMLISMLKPIEKS